MGEMADIDDAYYSSLYSQWLDNLKNNIDKLIWLTKDDEEIAINKMENSHLKNCIKLLANQRHRVDLPDRAVEEYLKIFKEEVEKRNLTREMS